MHNRQTGAIYRVDIHRHTCDIENTSVTTTYEVTLAEQYFFRDYETVQAWMRVHSNKERFRNRLYAVYIYSLPLHSNVADSSYIGLKCYDHNAELVSQSVCSRLSDSRTKFYGRDAASIRFKPGDIVEVYDREKKEVRLAVVIKQPPTIEQCRVMRKEVELACIVEGKSLDRVDDEYWLGADDDCYCLLDGSDYKKDHFYAHTTDVYAPLHTPSHSKRFILSEYYRRAIESYPEEINASIITRQSAIAHIKSVRRIADSL